MSGMHLMPVYYSTLNTRKRKKGKKSKSLLEAERKHEKFLKRIMGTSGGANGTISVNEYQGESHRPAEGSIPSLPPTSNRIPVGVTPKKKIHDHNFTIAPAYNKGSYQVISRRDIKDIGR